MKTRKFNSVMGVLSPVFLAALFSLNASAVDQVVDAPRFLKSDATEQVFFAKENSVPSPADRGRQIFTEVLEDETPLPQILTRDIAAQPLEEEQMSTQEGAEVVIDMSSDSNVLTEGKLVAQGENSSTKAVKTQDLPKIEDPTTIMQISDVPQQESKVEATTELVLENQVPAPQEVALPENEDILDTKIENLNSKLAELKVKVENKLTQDVQLNALGAQESLQKELKSLQEQMAEVTDQEIKNDLELKIKDTQKALSDFNKEIHANLSKMGIEKQEKDLSIVTNSEKEEVSVDVVKENSSESLSKIEDLFDKSKVIANDVMKSIAIAKSEDDLNKNLPKLDEINSNIFKIEGSITNIENEKAQEDQRDQVKELKDLELSLRQQITDKIASLGNEEQKDNSAVAKTSNESNIKNTAKDDSSKIAKLEAQLDAALKSNQQKDVMIDKRNNAYCALNTRFNNLNSRIDNLEKAKQENSTNILTQYFTALMPTLTNMIANQNKILNLLVENRGIERGLDGQAAQNFFSGQTPNRTNVGMNSASLNDLVHYPQTINYTYNYYGAQNQNQQQNQSQIIQSPADFMMGNHNQAREINTPFAYDFTNSSDRTTLVPTNYFNQMDGQNSQSFQNQVNGNVKQQTFNVVNGPRMNSNPTTTGTVNVPSRSTANNNTPETSGTLF